MIDTELEEVLALKQKATVLRNRGKYDQALKVLDDAMARLTRMAETSRDDKAASAKIRAEMADTHGMKGGVHRRRDDRHEALKEYRRGLTAEEQDSKSTYNLGNVILLSIALSEASPSDKATRDSIQRAIAWLAPHTDGSRSDEWWAWSDLGQFQLLHGDFDGARASYQRGAGTGPTAAEYQRHVDLLRELAAALAQREPDFASRMEKFVDELVASRQ